jgi:hypothetical protein
MIVQPHSRVSHYTTPATSFQCMSIWCNFSDDLGQPFDFAQDKPVGIVVLIVYHAPTRCQAQAVAHGVACPEFVPSRACPEHVEGSKGRVEG